MATQQELIDDIFNYLQGGGPRPTWLNNYRNGQIGNMVDYAHNTLAAGVNDPRGYIGAMETTLRSLLPSVDYGVNVTTTRNPDRVYPTAPGTPSADGNVYGSAPNGQNALTPYKADPFTSTTGTNSSGQSTTTVPGTFAEYIKAHPDGGDAYAYVASILKQYNLDSLDGWAQGVIQNGLTNSDQIIQQLREQDAYKQRFQAIVQRQQKGLTPVSEDEVINYEKQATQIMRSAGLPEGFWDSPDDFVKLQTSDISVNELNDRVTNGYLAVMQAPQDVRDQWASLGYGTGDMVAYWLDPTRTEAVLTKQLAATQRAAEAQRTGFGQLSTAEAEHLAALGTPSDQAQQGFGTLVKDKELFSSLPGENGSSISREQQLAAVFDKNAPAQQAIDRRAEQRKAAFAGGGSFAPAGQDGRTGIGVAQ